MLPAEALQWPMLLDMTKEECQRVLRRLELTAYSGVVSAFRGQGQLSKEKRRLLAELAGALGVPADRHRAEARRAANDEALNTIAHRLAGAGTRTDWAVEGRRVVPVLPRGRPITAYTAVADASRARTERLSGRLLPPADTRSYEPAVEELPPPEISPTKMTAALLSPPPPPAAPPPPPVPVSVQQPAAAAAAPHLRPPSPTPGVIRLPSGMSIQLEDELQGRGRKRRRSSSSGDAGPRIHPPPAARTPASHPQEAYTVRLPPPALPPPLPPGFSPAALPGNMGRPRHPAPGQLQPPGGRQGGPRPVGVSASRAPPLPTAVTATATVNTSSGHKVIFVSSSGGAPSSVVACPPRNTPPSSEPGTPSGPGPGVIQGPGGGVMPGTAERRQRPPAQLEPNTDTYRQLAGLDSTGSPLPPGGGGGGPGRARGRGGRRQAATGPGAPVRNATRVASGVKIITHTVPLAAASGTKVVTKGGGQPVLVMPSSGAAPTAAAAAAAAARSGLAVRTAAGGRVVTVSGGGAARPLVRQQPSLHGYALPRAVHVGRSPSGGSPTSRPPASVIVLQKGAAGRPPTVVRPPRPRAEPSAPAAVFVSAPHAPAPAGRPSVVSVPLVSAPAPVVQPVVQPLSVPTVQPQPQPAAAPVSAQDQQKLNNSSVLSDILHATGIINPKSAQDGSALESPPLAATAQKPSAPKAAPAPHPAPAPLPVPASVADVGRPPPSSPSREPPQPAPPPPPRQQQHPQQQQQSVPAPVVRRGPAPAPVQLAEADCSSDTGPSLTLEQAVELLNQQSGDPEQSRQILRQAGIRLAEPGPGTVIATAEAAHQMTGGDRLPSEPGMELVGELDPQTGIFYPVTPNSAGGVVLEGSDLVQDGAGETLEDISAFLQQRHDTQLWDWTVHDPA